MKKSGKLVPNFKFDERGQVRQSSIIWVWVPNVSLTTRLKRAFGNLKFKIKLAITQTYEKFKWSRDSAKILSKTKSVAQTRIYDRSGKPNEFGV